MIDIDLAYKTIQETCATFIEGLKNYSKEEFEHKESDEIWSLAEMHEHLSLTSTKFFLANVKRCLEKRKGQVGGETNENGKKFLQHNSFPPIKVKVPGGNSNLPETHTQEEYIKGFAIILESAQLFLKPIKADSGEYKIQHPVFEFLNAQEWYAHLDMHLRHHLRQKKELEGFAKA